MDSISFEYQYTTESYVTFAIKVKSGEFSGVSNFCILESSLKAAILVLNEMLINLNGSYQINDYDSDDFIYFEMKTLGHMTIMGQLGGSCNIPFLKFENCADQTILAETISIFNNMIRKRP